MGGWAPCGQNCYVGLCTPLLTPEDRRQEAKKVRHNKEIHLHALRAPPGLSTIEHAWRRTGKNRCRQARAARKLKPRQFLSKVPETILWNFAPAKISCYTVSLDFRLCATEPFFPVVLLASTEWLFSCSIQESSQQYLSGHTTWRILWFRRCQWWVENFCHVIRHFLENAIIPEMASEASLPRHLNVYNYYVWLTCACTWTFRASPLPKMHWIPSTLVNIIYVLWICTCVWL